MSFLSHAPGKTQTAISVCESLQTHDLFPAAVKKNSRTPRVAPFFHCPLRRENLIDSSSKPFLAPPIDKLGL
jgi:hypothetical protein